MPAPEPTLADLDALATFWHDGWHEAHPGLFPEALSRRRTHASFRGPLLERLPRVREMWTVLYVTRNGDGKTLLRFVRLGFAGDADAQRMRWFFEQGNAYALTQLQKRFAQ